MGEDSAMDLMTGAKFKPTPGLDAAADAHVARRAEAEKAGRPANTPFLPSMPNKDAKGTTNPSNKTNEGDYNEDQLTPKQQKFAKLAPPPNKITYADKIAGAKKSKMKDEGNEFSGELAKAKAQHKDKFNVGGKTYPVKEGFPTVADAKKRMDDREGKTAHGKKTITKTGTKHERDYDAVDRGADVDMTPKGRGRPKKDRFA
jgi:hypothetical protein